MPNFFLAYLVLHQFSHQISSAYKKLNDCCNLLNCEILQELILKIYVITPMRCTSKRSSYVTIFAYPTSATWDLNSSSSSS